MCWLIPRSKITIGSYDGSHQDFEFSGVHQIHIKKSIHSIVEFASVTVPSIARYIPKNGSMPVTVTTGTQFKDGDPITISLGYSIVNANGITMSTQMQTEFEGFVKRRDLAMPLVIECEGYVRELRLKNNISGNFKSTSAKKLLALATEGTDITVDCPVDFPLTGISLAKNSGVQICDLIKEASDHTLTLFFISSKVLWCGLPYTEYATGGSAKPLQLLNNKTVTGNSYFGLPGVAFRLGWNTVKDNQLKERIPSEPVQVIMKGKRATGGILYAESKKKAAVQKVHSLQNHIGDTTTLGKFAQEKEYHLNYTGYEGKIQGFLQPYCLPGYDAYIKDSRYPELEGTYVIESTEVVFGVNGARRHIEIGPKVGFKN